MLLLLFLYKPLMLNYSYIYIYIYIYTAPPLSQSDIHYIQLHKPTFSLRRWCITVTTFVDRDDVGFEPLLEAAIVSVGQIRDVVTTALPVYVGEGCGWVYVGLVVGGGVRVCRGGMGAAFPVRLESRLRLIFPKMARHQ